MGKKELNTAADIMTRRLIVLAPDASVKDATHTLLRRKLSGAPVTTPEGELQGVFSEHDSLRALTQAVYTDWPSGRVADHMTTALDTIGPDEDLAKVSQRLTEGNRRRLLVVAGSKLLGIITRSDLLRALDHMLDTGPTPTTYELISARRD